MNKIPITNPVKDCTLKYLQIIREKEESVEALKLINEKLEQENKILTSQISESFENEKRKIKKLEENNNQLKSMLKETQNYVLQYQEDLIQFQKISELLLTYTQMYKFNQKASLEQIVNFLGQEVFNEELIELWQELKRILINILKQTDVQSTLAQLQLIYNKYYQNTCHPSSTKAILEQIIIIVQQNYSLEFNQKIQNYSDQFQSQCQKINLFETSFVMINQEEEILRSSLQKQQKKIEKLEVQIEEQNLAYLKLQEQQAITLQSLEQKPHIEILSAQDLSSSSSEEENIEIGRLNNQLAEKDNKIAKLQQNINNIEIKLQQFMMANQNWDLIIDCTNDSLTSIYNDGWTLNFKHEFGLSAHQILCSFYGLDSSCLQFVLENIFNSDFNFLKLPSQQYFQLGNNQLLYLKQILNNDLNVLIQTKVLNQQDNDFYVSSFEGKSALSEFFIQYSLQHGILFLCLNNLDHQHEILLENVLQIKHQYQNSILIVILNDENLGQESVLQLCSKYSLTLYSDQILDQYGNFLVLDYDTFNFEVLVEKMQKNEMQNYLQNLYSFFTASLPLYFTKEENAQLEIKQSTTSDSVYEMKLVQQSQSIKLKFNRDSQIIREKQYCCLKKSDSQYEIIFPQKIEEVRLKTFIMKDKGILIRIKCQFDDDNLTTKQYILKSSYKENNENEISYTILDNKLALQL